MRLGIGSWILVVGLLIACQPMDKAKEEIPDLPPIIPVLNFSGNTLRAKTFPDSTYQVLLGNMLAAKAQAEQYPDSVDLAIWYGRRMAYMGRYHEAIDIFSDAINRFPNDHRLLRHRGHRYITTRQLNKAIADFARAAELCGNAPNAIEPDGIPNKLDKPLSNEKFNIYYHQGLAYYLNGEFSKALGTYKRCMEVSDNDDLKVATSYWMYMSYIRSGDLEAAQQFLQETETDALELIENDVYLELLQVFKGEKTGEEILTMPGHPTYQYGIGFYHWSNGNEKMARSVWQNALVHDSWDSFGYIAAEAERDLIDEMGISATSLFTRYGLTQIADLSDILGQDFRWGAASDYTDSCTFYFECDCCFGDLTFAKSRFTYVDWCIETTSTVSGNVLFENDMIILVSDSLRSMKEYNYLHDEDETQPEYYEYDTLMQPFRAEFFTGTCNNKLVMVSKDNSSIAVQIRKE